LALPTFIKEVKRATSQHVQLKSWKVGKHHKDIDIIKKCYLRYLRFLTWIRVLMSRVYNKKSTKKLLCRKPEAKSC